MTARTRGEAAPSLLTATGRHTHKRLGSRTIRMCAEASPCLPREGGRVRGVRDYQTRALTHRHTLGPGHVAERVGTVMIMVVKKAEEKHEKQWLLRRRGTELQVEVMVMNIG